MPEQGGSKKDLVMVSGGDTMLDICHAVPKMLYLQMDTQAFVGADGIDLTTLCGPLLAAGYC